MLLKLLATGFRGVIYQVGNADVSCIKYDTNNSLKTWPSTAECTMWKCGWIIMEWGVDCSETKLCYWWFYDTLYY